MSSPIVYEQVQRISGAGRWGEYEREWRSWAEPLKAQRLDRLLRDLDHIDQNGQAKGAALHTVLLYLLVQSGPRDFMSLVHHLMRVAFGPASIFVVADELD